MCVLKLYSEFNDLLNKIGENKKNSNIKLSQKQIINYYYTNMNLLCPIKFNQNLRNLHVFRWRTII